MLTIAPLIENVSPEDLQEMWGFVPHFLREDDPRGAKEQFNDRYIGGWLPSRGFVLDAKTMTLSSPKYPGDDDLKPLSLMTFRDEDIYLYDYSYVLVMDQDDNWEVCRMD